MILVFLNYKVPVEMLDQHLDAHRAWLKAGAEQGILAAAGRKVPRTGGLLLARGSREAVEAWVKGDPFAVHDLADYDFTEVDFTLTADGLEGLKA